MNAIENPVKKIAQMLTGADNGCVFLLILDANSRPQRRNSRLRQNPSMQAVSYY